MENRASKRRENGDDDDVVGSDRISQLPESLLLHMLCFLSQKKAVQTSVLSKSWRHLGPTRPVIDFRRSCYYLHRGRIVGFCENCFDENDEALTSVLDETFQRYHDLNLFAKELSLNMLKFDSKSIRVLEKWIPMFINPDKPAVNTFRLSFSRGPCFNLPSIVFKAESLQELDLNMCKIDSIDNVVLKNLQKLSLSSLVISNEALEKIIAGCPLVKCVVLDECKGFKTISIADENHYLRCFGYSSFYLENIGAFIEIDAPTLESINPNLKSLYLSKVKLPTEPFDNFSCNFPRLEELTLEYCCGFEDIELSSCSVKRLIIRSDNPIKKVAVDVPNILYFEFLSDYLPTTFSLTTTSTEWKSDLDFLFSEYDDEGEDVIPRILKLFEMVKTLSQSQISVSLFNNFNVKIKQINWDFNDHPVVVEHLSFSVGKLCPDSLCPDSPTYFLNALLRIFRPRYINSLNCNSDEEFIEFLWKTFIQKRKKTEYGWEQHLDDVIMEASDMDGILWHHVPCSRLPQWSTDQRIRFRLKWNDLLDY